MNENLLLQEITIADEQKIVGGGYSFNSPLVDVDIDINFNINFDIENLSARSGDLIANNGGKITGSSSGGVSIGNIG